MIYPSRIRRLASAMVLLLAVGPAMAGCQSGAATDWHAAAVSSATPSATAASPTPGPSTPPAPSGPMYRAGSDLCGRIPFTALGNWLSGRPTNLHPNPQTQQTPTYDEVDCAFSANSLSRRLATEVDVDCWVYDSVADARSDFTTFDKFSGGGLTFDVTTSNYDRSFAGYGGDANGYYYSGGDTAPTPYASSSYLIVFLKGNVILGVYVELHDFTSKKYSKQTMAARVGPETKAIGGLLRKA